MQDIIFEFRLDATKDDNRLGRLLNHSRHNPNAEGKVIEVDGKPRVYFVALKQILFNSFIEFEYGERRKDVLRELVWMTNS
jgi:hypothetical protein